MSTERHSAEIELLDVYKKNLPTLPTFIGLVASAVSEETNHCSLDVLLQYTLLTLFLQQQFASFVNNVRGLLPPKTKGLLRCCRLLHYKNAAICFEFNPEYNKN